MDPILIETIFDTLNAKAAAFAVDQVFEEDQITLPVMISGTITDASGRTLSGQTVEAFYNSLRHVRPLSIGLNCALGPDALRPHVEDLARVAESCTSFHPNAGLPNEMGEYDMTPDADGRAHPRMGGLRLRQHRRRLLRQFPGPYPGHRGGDGR